MDVGRAGIEQTIKEAQNILDKSPNLPPEIRAVFSVLLSMIIILLQKKGLNSGNSSLPPSKDPIGFKKERSLRPLSGRQRGGQLGHVGTTLEKVPDPDEIIEHHVKSCIGCGKSLQLVDALSFESRQVFEIVMKTFVVEHRAEVKSCRCCGKRNVATFPSQVKKAVQYGPQVKALSCYMSQFQLIPYNRIVDFFRDTAGLPISQGSLVNFNEEAYFALAGFEKHVQAELFKSKVNHADETGIKVDKGNYWVHVLSNERWTYLFPHIGRNATAGLVMGVLEAYEGFLVHDHCKFYFQFEKCKHVLCNAHHLRELEWSHEFEGQRWAKKMNELLVELNERVKVWGKALPKKEQLHFQRRYRRILDEGDKECPINETRLAVKSKNGKLKQTKSRNLLIRLRDFEKETLMFMRVSGVPFTNNQAERDFRMTKVQQKVSGCFRSLEGAQMFCRIRSFLSTARKNSQSPLRSLTTLFAENSWNFAE